MTIVSYLYLFIVVCLWFHTELKVLPTAYTDAPRGRYAPPTSASYATKAGAGTIMIASGYTITCLPNIIKYLNYEKNIQSPLLLGGLWDNSGRSRILG